jgi:SnoaL-like protein
VRGRDAIRAYLGGVGTDLARDTTVPLIRHHVSNLRIDVVSATEARGACYFLAVTEHGVDHWGRYRDQYAPAGDRWLFAHRFVRTDGTTPGGWAANRT